LENSEIREIWKKIIRYEELYEVSNLGRIKSISRKYHPNETILKQHEYGNYGHMMVILSKKNKHETLAVHRLVLESFIGLRPKNMECRHLDGNAKNNRLENLRWGTPKENCADKIAHGKQFKFDPKKSIGSNNIKAKLTEWMVRIIKKLLLDKNFNYKQISKLFNISICTIRDIDKNRTWRHIRG